MAQQDKTTVTRQSNNKCVVRTGQTPVDGHVEATNRAWSVRQKWIQSIVGWAEEQDRAASRLCDFVEQILKARHNP